MTLEARLAALLQYGTWLASAVTAVGLLFSPRIITLGIAIFILLPVLRVLAMLIDFIRTRDYRYAALAGLVLAVILLSLAVGARET
jgi:uncharacterized membrane protein